MASVLLVLGNGFDLACGLQSSFSDYLSSDYYKPYLDMIRSINSNLDKALIEPKYDGYAIYNKYYMRFDPNITFWDLYFGLQKESGDERWHDFETMIKEFINDFYNQVSETVMYASVCKRRVDHDCCNDSEYKRNLVLYKYFEQNNICGDLLLYQLKDYEKRFGKYIFDQQSNHSDYQSKAISLISTLLNNANKDEVVYINSFNYSNLSFVAKDIWHINGDVDNPIFGIDLPKTDPNEPSFKFTKTYRRLELTGKSAYCPTNKKYTKVVVYGHSLNEQDYSYFFSLFNILGLSNDRYYSSNSDKFIEFVYSKHDGKTSEEVRQGLVANVLKMFYKYNREVLHQDNFRLIDILFSSGAVRFKEAEKEYKSNKPIVCN